MSGLIPGAVKRYIIGQVTLNGVTPQQVSVPGLRPDSIVLLSMRTPSGTQNAAFVSAKDADNNTISVRAGSGNTSVYDVVVFV